MTLAMRKQFIKAKDIRGLILAYELEQKRNDGNLNVLKCFAEQTITQRQVAIELLNKNKSLGLNEFQIAKYFDIASKCKTESHSGDYYSTPDLRNWHRY